MKPLIALVGRPNVGKSTLFNCLTRSRAALVANQAGSTRDRHYGEGKVGCINGYRVVDMGGIGLGETAMDSLVAAQARTAMAEADTIFFLVDGRQGWCAVDQTIADAIRPLGKPVFVIVNKTDGVDETVACAEFGRLGFAEIIPIAASHGHNVTALMEWVCGLWQAEAEPEAEIEAESEATPEAEPPIDDSRIRVCVVGRPNVGKSTLINRLLGEERVLTFDQPGTTRDSIFIPFERNGKAYTLIDTAGIRRRGKISETIEKFSVVKSLESIKQANVVILVVDAQDGVNEQDAHLLGTVLDSGRALVIAINKWDGLDDDQRQHTRITLERRFAFIDFAKIHWISARHGTGVGEVMRSVDSAYKMAMRRFSTHELTDLLQRAVTECAPPQAQGRAIRLRYVHQGGHNPPLFIIHGNRTEQLTEAYKRYLSNTFRQYLKLSGTPVRFEFKTGENPFAGIKNPLTERQQQKRKRLQAFTKKNRR